MIETNESAASPTPTPEGAREVGRVQWWLDTIVAMSQKLREAGISTVSVGEYSATLLPAEPPAPKFEEVKNDVPAVSDTIDALHDPRSYPGGVVPGFNIERLSDGEF